MIKTLRTKLLIGITPLLAIMVGLGLWAIVMFSRLGNNIEVILKENYRSVLAAEGMKEALERLDSAFLFAIGGEEAQAQEQFHEYRPVFERHLRIEQHNVTLPSEQRMADNLTALRTRHSRWPNASLSCLPPGGRSGPGCISLNSCRPSRTSSARPTPCST